MPETGDLEREGGWLSGQVNNLNCHFPEFKRALTVPSWSGFCSGNLRCKPGGEGGISYDGLYGEALPERGTFHESKCLKE